MKWIIGKKYKYKGWELSNMHDTQTAELRGQLVRGQSYRLIYFNLTNETGTIEFLNGGQWNLGLACLQTNTKTKNLPSWW